MPRSPERWHAHHTRHTAPERRGRARAAFYTGSWLHAGKCREIRRAAGTTRAGQQQHAPDLFRVLGKKIHYNLQTKIEQVEVRDCYFRFTVRGTHSHSTAQAPRAPPRRAVLRTTRLPDRLSYSGILGFLIDCIYCMWLSTCTAPRGSDERSRADWLGIGLGLV